MDYNYLFDTAMEIGYQLAMCGAETFRIEESVTRIMAAYGAKAEVFAIPNSMTASVITPDGSTLARLRRIGFHGNDLDTVERYSNLGRRICTEKPSPEIAAQWLQEAKSSRKKYSLPVILLGNMIAAIGFCLFFGGTVTDSLFSAVCGLIVGIVSHISDKLKINNFFTTMTASFAMAFVAYSFGALKVGCNPDAAIISAMMMLVPGLIFTNAMRDIIFGDTNSGVNRLVQVILIAFAIGLGTSAARGLAASVFGTLQVQPLVTYGPLLQCLAAMVGCAGFCILFNVHGFGSLICILGGALSWAVYCIASLFLPCPVTGYFFAAVFAAAFAETMARIRHFPAITYLVVAIFPMIPGGGIYYSASFLADGNTAAFSAKSAETVAIAGLMAVGILLVSTIVRGRTVWKQQKNRLSR